MNNMQIKINTSELGAEASAFMEELTKMLQEQAGGQNVSVVEETVSVPNTKGVVLSGVLLTFASEVAKGVAVALILRVVDDLIDKFYSKKDAKNVTVTESPNGVVIINNGDHNTYNITVNVVDD